MTAPDAVPPVPPPAQWVPPVLPGPQPAPIAARPAADGSGATYFAPATALPGPVFGGVPPALPRVRLKGPGAWGHVRRALQWNVGGVRPAERELARLEAAGIREPRVQAMLVWRRSSLLVVLPVLLVSLALSIGDAASEDMSDYTPLGQFTIWMTPLALALVPLACAVLINNWTDVRATSHALVTMWAASVIIPLIAAIMPLDLVVDVASVRLQIGDDPARLAELNAALGVTRLYAAASYSMNILPVIVSVPAGVLRGASRVKSLFPAASLPGWFLVAVAPFYSLFMIVVFVVIDQVVGNLVLVAAIALLAFSPWLFVINRKIYGRPMSTEEARTALPRAGRFGGWVTLAGFALVVLYAVTAQVDGKAVLGANHDDAHFTYLQVGHVVVDVLARNIVTSVVFCLIFLNMVYREWATVMNLRADIRREHDAEMLLLSRYAEGPDDTPF